MDGLGRTPPRDRALRSARPMDRPTIAAPCRIATLATFALVGCEPIVGGDLPGIAGTLRTGGSW
jgi:hypothetical protein